MLPSTATTSTASTCQLTTFFVGVTEVCFMSAPVGSCLVCCPHDDAFDIKFEMFTRANPTTPAFVTAGDAESLHRTSFNATNPTVMYLHGFTEATTGQSTTTLRDAYLSTGDYNFIAVNWSRLVAFPWYIEAVFNSRYMGQKLADFVQFLDGAGARADLLHIIGFSLGAEAAGFGGKELTKRGLQVARITGLDPAYPGYALTSSDGHLTKGDAAFVDIVHTNPGVFGFPQPIGDVDFYPNPGSLIQPGCWIDQLYKNNQMDFFYGCSHNRAWRLYAESVRNPQGFPATLCRHWEGLLKACSFHVDGYMGLGARPPLSGKMYLATNDKPSFARNGP